MLRGRPIFFGLWFAACYAATQLALQLHQERIHVVRSNRVAQKRPARVHSRNGPFLVFGLLCRHTMSTLIAAGTHTSGAQ